LEIQNVVSTADLRQDVDATKFIQYAWGSYDFERYGGRCGYVKDHEIQGRVTVFLSGKMISTGAKSVSKSIQQLEHTGDLLVRDGFIKRIKLELKVQNIVATSAIKSKIDLNLIASTLNKLTFEPEQFPALYTEVLKALYVLSLHLGKL
jgi:TATA-box binding protein (TBP) (component of TFIID and TFIIIB)